MPVWTSIITYASEDLGLIDLEFDYDTMSELDTYILRGPGITTIRKIVTTPFLKPFGRSDTIEAVVGRLAIIEELKQECCRGAIAAPARFPLARTGDRANAEFDQQVQDDFANEPGHDSFGAHTRPGPDDIGGKGSA